MSGLNYKCLGGDLLIFKNLNDCMTISRSSQGDAYIKSIEFMGGDKSPFTKEEKEYWLKQYENTDAGKR